MKTLVGAAEPSKLGAKFYVIPSDHTPLAQEHLISLRSSNGKPFSIYDYTGNELEFEQDAYGSFWREPKGPISIPRDNYCVPDFFHYLKLRQITVLTTSIFFHPKSEPMLFREGHYRLSDSSAICVITKMNHVCGVYCALAPKDSVCQNYFWQVESLTGKASFDIRGMIKRRELTKPYRPLHI